ncbi:hypothetical protein [Bosea sp. (in: a-proteobacteria)]|uniref:hypothetical protein n=1 Tax=Bosea sp. (in: a-proteobacteria) TaxID=1871050 RepID=UPI0025C5CC4B|nr:hypothetical protein [Bosea sp. (in: a-proteobacteria)]
MTKICIKFLWGLTILVSFFGIIEIYVPDIVFLGGNLKAGWWGLCGALAGQWITISYGSAKKIQLAGEGEIKKFNEQIKLSASFLNAFAIGVVAYAIFQKLNSAEGIFNWGTLIAVWIGVYFHYLAIKMLDLWRPEK